MQNVNFTANGRTYTVLVTRNITAANQAKGEHGQHVIKVWYDGLLSKFYVKPLNYWKEKIFAGSFHYDMENDRITYLSESDNDEVFLFVFRHIVDVLNDNDIIIVSVKRGRFIERYRINASVLKKLIGAGETEYGLYPVNKCHFEKLKPIVKRGRYAKR